MTGILGVTFVGGPTALLALGGVKLLTDPTFSPAGEHETAPGRTLTKTEDPALTEIGPVDAVLLSHDQHSDNLDPAGRALLATMPLTLTTPSAAERLGGTARGLAPWETTTIGTLTVTAVPALHGPPGSEPVTGDVTGFVVHGDEIPTVYVSGDNASLDLVREIAARFDIDVAVLFAGAARTSIVDGPLTLTSADAAAATRILDAPHVIPLHTQGWAHFTEGPQTIKDAFAAAGLSDRLHLLAPGDHVTL